MSEEKARSWRLELMRLQGRLLRQREAKGLTQDELAKRLGTSRRTFQRWEAGEAEPKVIELYQWADLLGIDILSEVRVPGVISDARPAGLVQGASL